MPVILTEHSTPSMASRGRWNSLANMFLGLAYRRADAIVAVSHGVAEDLARTLRISDQKIRVIYNPIVDDRLRRMAEEPLKWTPPVGMQNRLVIFVGRLVGSKNVPLLLRAAHLLLDRAAFHLVIAGDGPDQEALRKLALELGLANRVTFLGYVENPYPLMRQACVFVLPSNFEGLPTVLVEAMACGTQVVSTDCPSGPREILEGGKWGELVPVNDAVALADAIERALSGANRRASEIRAEAFETHLALHKYRSLIEELAGRFG